MLRLRIFLVLLAVLLTSCNMQALLWPGQGGKRIVETYANPHTNCSVCHDPDPENPERLVLKTDPSSICEYCHHYTENHHPVDFSPKNPSDIRLPLYESRIRCLTCHEIHGGQEGKGTPKLLRGGPYEDRRTICNRCHSFTEFEKTNPHVMLNSDGSIRKINGKPVCLICHSKQPDPAVDWTETVRFRADVGFLCWRCHPPMPGIFFDQHFLVEPSAKTLQNIKETEERLLVILPLVPRNRITCSTCHNPHQKGVIQREAAARGAGAYAKLRLPSICFACHRV